MNRTITIADAKRIRETLGMARLIIFAADDQGNMHVATHGKTELDAAAAASAGNKLKHALGWPESLCNAQPLKRICGNCSKWASKDPTQILSLDAGKCQRWPNFFPARTTNACPEFEPRG